MSAGLVVERLEGEITLEEWKRIVARHCELRLRDEPYRMRSPRTGDIIEMAAGVADAELFVDGEWLPLLRYGGGKLETEYSDWHDDPAGAERLKIVLLARELGAVIRTDLSDEPLRW